MILQTLWEFIQEDIFPFDSTDELWNPYKGIDPKLDLAEADLIRQQNLFDYIHSFKKHPPILLVGEAPGPWGCRFSGIAFTSERQLSNAQLPFKGQASSLFNPPVIERSGTILWKILEPYHPNFFLWNCIPYHPYKAREPLSIRTPRKTEITQFSPLLEGLVKRLNPQQILAVGRKAELSLKHIGLEASYVRHPSRGGSKEFNDGMTSVFKNL